MNLHHTLIRSLITTLLVGAALPVGAEGLLWKTESRYQPQVVPPYTGQASPFPLNTVAKAETTEGPTLEQVETERLQQETIEHATQLINSSQALMPYMEGTVVGGLVEGVNGRKILVGNEWVGTGMNMQVRLMASDAVKDAISKVSEFNQDTAKSLREQLSLRLRQTPVTQMKLKEIRSDALVLTGEYGQKVMKIIMR